MLLQKNPNHTKFCGNRLKNAGDICDRKFVLAEKVGQCSPKFYRRCYPLRAPIMPNFIEIGQTSLEKSITKIGPRTQKTSGSAMAEGPRNALSVEILQLQNIPFEN